MFFLKWPLHRWADLAEILQSYEASIALLQADKKMAGSGQVTELAFERAPDSEACHTLL